jgi:hypothetical protein
MIMLAGSGVTLFVISLGPVLHWQDRETSIRLPYGWLYDLVPGFDAMRVPTRAALFVGLSVSGLAAVALHQWWSMPGRRAHLVGRVITVLGIIVIALEAWTHPLPFEKNGDYWRHLEAQTVIRALPPGVVVVLPIERRLNYLVPLTTWPHFYPLVNGVSGHLPPINGRIFETLSASEWGGAQAALLRLLEVRYVVVDHTKEGAGILAEDAHYNKVYRSSGSEAPLARRSTSWRMAAIPVRQATGQASQLA